MTRLICDLYSLVKSHGKVQYFFFITCLHIEIIDLQSMFSCPGPEIWGVTYNDCCPPPPKKAVQNQSLPEL